jgi:hypothetical protein
MLKLFVIYNINFLNHKKQKLFYKNIKNSYIIMKNLYQHVPSTHINYDVIF